MTYEIAVLDMAGTTVADDGLIEQAFSAAVAKVGIDTGDNRHASMLEYARATMGESRVSVFRTLFGEGPRADLANAAFERAYAELIDDGRCVALPGAEDAIEHLRSGGLKVALTTSFSRSTLSRVLRSLDWDGLVDLTLCPADAGRGRPFPDLALTALLALEGTRVGALVTAGDTVYDIKSGRAAGAGLVAGVLSGAHAADAMWLAGADEVLSSISELPALVLNR